MRRTVTATSVLALLALSSCGMMMKPMASMMGMGDKLAAMENMDEVMGKGPQGMRQHMQAKQRAAIASGRKLFNDTSLGSNGQSCNSCHPGGGTTGGEAQVPTTSIQMPIPTLVGASTTFPKFKAPNNAVISLQQMDNNCIRMFMAGDGLDLENASSYDLAAFVSSLSNGEPVRVGR